MMVTDRHRYDSRSDTENIRHLIAAIGRAARAGIDLIQVRERDLPDPVLVDLVREAISSARETRARVIVNERTDVAIAADAAGVHLRSTCPSAARVRAIVPPEFLIGRSIHSRSEAEAAVREGGCDYLLFGTVFPSTSKAASHPIPGVAALEEVCEAAPMPVLAIGGITELRARETAHAGASGVAAIELFAHGDEGGLREAIQRVRRAFNST